MSGRLALDSCLFAVDGEDYGTFIFDWGAKPWPSQLVKDLVVLRLRHPLFDVHHPIRAMARDAATVDFVGIDTKRR